MSINLATRLSHLRVAGIALAAEAITDGTLEMTSGEASQLTVALADPDGALVKAPGAALGGSVSWGSLAFTVATLEHGPVNGVRTTTLTARAAGWQALKKRRGDRTWRGLSPTQVVRAECLAVGMTFVGQQTAVRKSIARLADGEKAADTSTLALIDRLAGEAGFVYGEAGGVFYFGAPSWLVKRSGWAVSGTAEFLLEYPTMSKTSDDKGAPARISLSVAGERPQEVLLPFSPVKVTGVPARFAGRYLVERVTVPLSTADAATVDLMTPTDPEKQAA